MPKTPITAQIDALKSAPPNVLQNRWKSAFRKAYPSHLPRSLVVQILAYRLQADIQGDLDPQEVAYLKKAAKEKGSPRRFGAEEGGHSPGTVFVREHGGQLHRAVKTLRGFEWDGKEFSSLSAVAYAITGTKWNGRRFFGLPSPREKHDGA